MSKPEMTAEHRARVEAFLQEQTDWLALCPRCGRTLQGTLAEINAHAAAHRREANPGGDDAGA